MNRHISDSQVERIADYELGDGASSNVNSFRVDVGSFTLSAIVLCAIACGYCVSVAWDVSRKFHDESVDIQEQYQRERNHVIELEARTKVNADEISALKQELDHVRR